MAYKIEYAEGVAKDLRHLPRDVKLKALSAVERVLSANPQDGKPLTGAYKGLWKYRIGDYRIIYAVEREKLVVFVLRIRHRKDVYRGIVY